MNNDEAFSLMCEHAISVEYDGSYINAWCADADVTLECADDDRERTTQRAIEMIASMLGEGNGSIN